MTASPAAVSRSSRGQAMAPPTVPIPASAFEPTDGTVLRWLGMAGFLINARGTLLAVDPLLEGFDMPVLIDFPIEAADIPRLDAVLVSHSDNDHYSVPTCTALAPVTRRFHSTRYVGELMTEAGMPAEGHDIGDVIDIGDVRITVTPADHSWQNAFPEPGQRVFRDEDCCGFRIDTPDGTIWAPGDSRLIRDHHLTMPSPDALLFDFSDSEWHFGFDGAVEMANAYPDADLLLHHWGSVDSPDFAPFNADPDTLWAVVANPQRIHVLAPGEPFRLGG
ncbi:L-ascorbate metabolism protein UlaG (beta-lactamase superfamily) [Microbacterium sp. ZKA21]|uniref:MBL fold metallo-hydrolase n=1 Tax=Microbacterium sp. ZKA21 TaxID=3381694 RepID=UPI003D1FAD8C